MNEKLTAQNKANPIDIQGFSTYCRENADLIQKLLDSFVQVGPPYLKELCDAIESNDADGIRSICHKIRGAGSIIRAEPLLEIVEEVRKSAVDANFDRAKGFLPELKKAFADVIDFIERFNAGSE